MTLFTILVNKRKNKTHNKGKGKVQPNTDIKKESICFFCKKKGHMKKDCMKHKVWLEKKGTSFSFVCYESISQMLIIILGGLTLVQQSMFQIPCRV